MSFKKKERTRRATTTSLTNGQSATEDERVEKVEIIFSRSNDSTFFLRNVKRIELITEISGDGGEGKRSVFISLANACVPGSSGETEDEEVVRIERLGKTVPTNCSDPQRRSSSHRE
jgi:hypothetical protein